MAVLGCRSPGRAPDAGTTSGTVELDASKVPEDLRSLVPIAQEWGIGDDVDRGHKVDAATPEARTRLREALMPHQARITAWLDSFGNGPMTDEAAAFMFTQLALDEIDASEGH